MIVGLSQVVLATAVMVIYEWRMALIALVGVILYLAMMRWFQKILASNYDEVRHEVGVSLGVLSESISAIPVVRSYGTEAITKTRVAEALERRFRRRRRGMSRAEKKTESMEKQADGPSLRSGVSRRSFLSTSILGALR